jgi:hypothetical protein
MAPRQRTTGVAETGPATSRSSTKARLPIPGTILTRPYKGTILQVKVLESGFEYEGIVYRTHSAVANAITGTHCNGFQFFRIGGGR